MRVLFGCIATMLGCTIEEQHCPPGLLPEDSVCIIDENEVAELVARFTKTGFVRVNAEPFAHQWGYDMICTIWVSETEFETPTGEHVTALSVYETIDPQNTSFALSTPMPQGTMFIHQSEEAPLGVMVKSRAGPEPIDNEWWFGRFNPAGSAAPLETDTYDCVACHSLRYRALRTDMLWGVPR